MHWESNHTPNEWDFLLAKIGGHPLQSALWGEAKKSIYGVSDQRLALYDKEELAALIRIEDRGLKKFLQLAWIPQGPTLAAGIEWKNIQDDFLKQLRKIGNSLCIFSPWKLAPDIAEKNMRKTVWIDLQLGKEKLWSALDKQWRYGVRSAERACVKICFATTKKDVVDFYLLCVSVSQKKAFHFQYSQLFLQYLLDHSNESGVEAKLFLVKLNNEIAAGAFILRVGKSCHYMWGAVDKKYSKFRVGEFIQWSVIEWACEKNCALYDLEGINEIQNPGVAAFKKKMGGEVVQLSNIKIAHFNLKGKILSRLIKRKLQWV